MIVLWFLMSAATGRIIRFLVDDTLIDRQRNWFLSHFEGKWYELFTCPWCLSAYISAGVVLATWIFQPMLLPLLMWFAVWWGGLFAYWTTECLARYGNGD